MTSLDFLPAGPWVDGLGYLAAILVFMAFFTKAMLPSRFLSILSNLSFIGYGALAGLGPVFLLHCALLPLNVIRLWQLRRLIAEVEVASRTDFSIDWLLPYMDRLSLAEGAALFRAGDEADRLFYIAKGTVELTEIDVQRGAGDMIGEIGVFSPYGRRTSSARCATACELLTISHQKVFDLYYQNPQFGIYLLRLITGRMVEEVDRLKAGR